MSDKSRHTEHHERLVAMAFNDGTWDFSPNDMECLNWALTSHDALLEALEGARRTIKTWHNMGLADDQEQPVWEAYQQSPEMKQIDAALASARGEGS